VCTTIQFAVSDSVDDDEQAITKAFYQDLNKIVRKLVGERELTAQEAALDALALPLVKYSCECLYVQARSPTDTFHMLRKKEDRRKRQRTDDSVANFEDLVYDPAVVKYIKSTCVAPN